MEKIIDIIDSIAYEKGLKVSEVEEALKESLIQTARKMVDETLIYEADIIRETKELKLTQKIEVVSNDDARLSGEVRAEPTKDKKREGKRVTF
jgi:N utilization substance protein A